MPEKMTSLIKTIHQCEGGNRLAQAQILNAYTEVRNQ